MNPALRTARAHLAAAVVTTAAAAYSMTINAWIGVCGFYIAAFLLWCTRGFYTQYHRTVAENEWAQRSAAGEYPPPLVPCCRLADASDGTAHDNRCTDPIERLIVQLNSKGTP